MKKTNYFLIAIVAIVAAYASFPWPPQAQAASATVGTVDGFEHTCTSSVTEVKPSDWNVRTKAVTCSLSKESPDDSAECACITGASGNATDECLPIGGCSRAVQTSISIDGPMHCIREDSADTVLVCLAGR